MSAAPAVATSEMGIFRRIVEGEETVFSKTLPMDEDDSTETEAD